MATCAHHAKDFRACYNMNMTGYETENYFAGYKIS